MIGPDQKWLVLKPYYERLGKVSFGKNFEWQRRPTDEEIEWLWDQKIDLEDSLKAYYEYRSVKAWPFPEKTPREGE